MLAATNNYVVTTNWTNTCQVCCSLLLEECVDGRNHTGNHHVKSNPKFLYSRSLFVSPNTFSCNKEVTHAYVLSSVWSFADASKTMKLWKVSKVHDHCPNVGKTLLQEHVFGDSNNCHDHEYNRFCLDFTRWFLGVNSADVCTVFANFPAWPSRCVLPYVACFRFINGVSYVLLVLLGWICRWR